MSLTKPHTLLFDWDNTLVDTWPIIHRALCDTFAPYGMEPWSMEQVKSYVARSMREAFPDIFGDRAEEAGELYMAAYRKYQFESLTPLPGAVEALKTLRNMPFRLGVVSNKRSEFLARELAHLELEEYFDTVVGAGDAEHDKPHAAPALLALLKLHVTPDKGVWFIGDSNADLECAYNAGVTPVLFGELIEQEHDAQKRIYRGWGYDAYAPGYKEFLELVHQSSAR